MQTMREVFVVGLVLAVHLSLGLPARGEGASLGQVVPQGNTQLNQTPLGAETTLYGGDTVATQQNGQAVLLLSQGSQVHLGVASAVQVAREQEEEGEMVLAGLHRGVLLVRSELRQPVAVRAADLLVRPEADAGLYQVELVPGGALVAAREGDVRVEGSNRTVLVAAGKAMRFEVVQSPQAEKDEDDDDKPRGPYAQGLTRGQKAAIAVAVGAGVATAIAVPLALDDDDDEEVSPSSP